MGSFANSVRRNSDTCRNAVRRGMNFSSRIQANVEMNESRASFHIGIVV
jgi:hypothetical protein